MKVQMRNPQFPSRARNSRRGFSFTEILFAVMILGIGFIMVAAMFPVAIRQTEATQQDTAGAVLGRTGAEFLAKLAVQSWPLNATAGSTTTSVLTVTYGNGYTYPTSPALSPGQPYVNLPGQVWTLHDSRTPATSWNGVALTGPPLLQDYVWSTAAANQIVPDDNRFAWVGMYRRDMVAPVTWDSSNTTPTIHTDQAVAASYAQLIVIGVQSRAKPAYNPYPPPSPSDIQHPTATSVATLEPDRLSAALTRVTATGITTIVFSGANAGRVAEGAYVVVSDDGYSGSDPRHGLFNGRIFRVGVQPDASNPNSWQLIPGYDLSASDGAVISGTLNATVLVVGRGVDATNNFSGPAQDVSAYTTFVQTSN